MSSTASTSWPGLPAPPSATPGPTRTGACCPHPGERGVWGCTPTRTWRGCVSSPISWSGGYTLANIGELIAAWEAGTDVAELLGLEQHTAQLPIACVEGWSTGDQAWTGVRLRDLARLAGVSRPASVLVASLERGGTFRHAVLSAGQIMDPDSLLALRVNGAELSLDHGYPARVIVLKTSQFREEEADGIFEALNEAGAELRDLVWVQESSSVKILRDGNYPVMRGTFVELDGKGLLYTNGSIPYYGTYPGLYDPKRCCYVPMPGATAPSRKLRKRCWR